MLLDEVSSEIKTTIPIIAWNVSDLAGRIA